MLNAPASFNGFFEAPGVLFVPERILEKIRRGSGRPGFIM
jgi:hypothetical protein